MVIRQKMFVFCLLFVLIASLMPVLPATGAVSEWQPGVSYTAGDLATYNGSTYECLQSHTSQIGWEPPNVPALWKLSGNSTPSPTPTATPTPTPTPTPTATATPTPTPTSTVGSCTAPAWNPSTAYSGGQIVSHNGHEWQANWWTQGEEPGTTGEWGAWKDLGACTGGTPTPTPTVTPTPTPTPTITPTPTPTATPPTGSGYKIIGYYPSWGAYGRAYTVDMIDASKLTHINYAFADICWNGIHGNPDPTGPNPQTWTCQDEVGVINVPNGTIVMGDPWIDAQKSYAGDTWDQPLKGNFNQLIKLKQNNPHLRTIISVGGWTWSNRFSDVAADASTRSVFAKSAVDFLRKYQFDGVDLDWEYPVSGGLAGNSYRPADKQNYTLLLQEIRRELDAAGQADGKHYLLTIASGAGPSYINNTELDKIAQTVDWINIMTYDFHGGWETTSGNNAPLYFDPADPSPNAADFNSDAAVQNYFQAGVPANKLVLGLPFYGRGWGGCAAVNNGLYQSCTGSLPQGTWDKGVYDFSDLEDNYINKNGYTRFWNNTTKTPWLYNATSGVFISYDDAQSISHKTGYIKTNGLAGAMFWESTSDRHNTLLNQVSSDLPR